MRYIGTLEKSNGKQTTSVSALAKKQRFNQTKEERHGTVLLQ
jgi:hypothetical protein